MMMKLLTTSAVTLASGFLVGIAHSSFRHYYRRYSDEEGMKQRGPVQEVCIVEDQTKGGKKK